MKKVIFVFAMILFGCSRIFAQGIENNKEQTDNNNINDENINKDLEYIFNLSGEYIEQGGALQKH